jgi:hypothetical protein
MMVSSRFHTAKVSEGTMSHNRKTPLRAKKPQQMVMGFFLAKTEMPTTTPLRVEAIPTLKQWFRTTEAATIFGVSDDTIRNWIDSGILDARLINVLENPERKHVRVTRESIVKLLSDTSRCAT